MRPDPGCLRAWRWCWHRRRSLPRLGRIEAHLSGAPADTIAEPARSACAARSRRPAACRCSRCLARSGAGTVVLEYLEHAGLAVDGEPVPLDHAWIEQHIPHKGRMCLLDAVLSWDATRIRCRSASHRTPDNPLRAHGRLGAACGIEYAAQAMAVHGALVAASAPLASTITTQRARQHRRRRGRLSRQRAQRDSPRHAPR